MLRPKNVARILQACKPILCAPAASEALIATGISTPPVQNVPPSSNYPSAQSETIKRLQHSSAAQVLPPADSGAEEMSPIIDGKSIALKLKASIRDEIARIRNFPLYADFKPGLAIVQVGDRPDSNVYIRNKIKFARDVGIDAVHIKIAPDTTEAELLRQIDDLNADGTCDGIIVQLPLETTGVVDSDAVIDRILPDKDVDGLTRENAGKLARGEMMNTVIPCTPRGCLHLVESAGVDVRGKRVVVLGRSRIVGGPAAALFLWNHGTVTMCHSRTENLREECRRADILVVAIGQPQLVQKDWIKPGAVVIDCGINVLEGQGPKGRNKLVGDVDFQSALEVASRITPVPGGVGPMTVAMLLKNTLDQAKKRRVDLTLLESGAGLAEDLKDV